MHFSISFKRRLPNGPANWFEAGPSKRLQTWLKLFATMLLAALALQSFRGGHISAQDFPTILGRIEGDDLDVVTTTPSGIETNGAPTVVASGSDITLRSGNALLLLNAGGRISICGPAHFKVLKSSGAVTLALDYGRVHPSLESADAFTIYTPTIIATPIAISGGPRDMTLGLEQGGEMCVFSSRGAMRVEPQFSDQSLLIPQGGTVNLTGGQIESLQGGIGSCTCEFSRAKLEQTQPMAPPREISALIHPLQPEPRTTDAAPVPPPAGEPIYTVLMPPLSFDANSPTPPPDPDPETALLVREVRLRPSVVYHGHVNPAPEPKAAPAVIPVPASPSVSDRPPEPQRGIVDRLRNLFRKFTGRGACAGAGCNS